MAKVKTIIEKARNYYFSQWRGNEKICPAFGEKVYVTKLGWNHIAYHPRRKLVDKIIRLKNLFLARELLETSTTYQTIEKRRGKYFYGFQAIKENKPVKVVVTSRTKKSKKILFSVMFKSLSKQQQDKIIRQNQKLINEFRKKHPSRIKK